MMGSRAEDDEEEERMVRSVALQNAKSILLARQRAEEALVQAKEALELRTQELARSLAMLRATLESTTDAILVTDGDRRVTGFNEKFVEMWRVPREVMGSGEHGQVMEVTSSYFEDPERFLRRIAGIYASSPPESYDLLELADGRVVERFSRIQFVEERNVGRVWSFRDITERRRDEQRLQQSEAQFKRAAETTRFLADASATLAELMDYESTLQRVAGLAVPAFADWCAVDMLQADGSVRRLAVTHADPARVHLAHEIARRYPPRPSDAHGLMKVLRTGEPEWAATIPDSLLEAVVQDEGHLALIRQLGLRSYICAPLRSRARTLGALSFVTAESGRVYDATDLAAAQDLAHRAVIAIENANLLTALKESDRRKDEFLAMLAHELRNPLAPIRNAAQIFRARSPLGPELQWATEVIDRQVDQMTRLIDDLLDVSRITRGKIQLRKERVELAAVVRSAVEASRPFVESGGHELTVTMPPEPIELEADLMRLSQVLLNLLNNAVKYTDRGGHIWLRAQREDGLVSIRVKDDGIGIPAEMLPRIFEMFTQVDRSLERSQGGLGIGLTLVQRLVEMHGGTVTAYSAGPGTGSEFVVRLPPAGEPGEQRPENPALGEARAATSSRRILVVDDNRDSADSLGMLLRMLGNEVRTAHDGMEAVSAEADFQPEVVLLDIGLPKLSGYGAARRIREARGDAVVLIAVTGWGQEEDRRRSAEAGFDHHLTKPVDLGTLHELLGALDARRER
jgi:signal transduction histidine kinase/CheY-like chemotaxis protein/PAS domain-containing protein